MKMTLHSWINFPVFSKVDQELEGIFNTNVSLIADIGRHSLLGGGKSYDPFFYLIMPAL